MDENRFLSILNSGGERFRFGGGGADSDSDSNSLWLGSTRVRALRVRRFSTLFQGSVDPRGGCLSGLRLSMAEIPERADGPVGFFFGLLGCGNDGKLDGSGRGG